jgi:hypothetical protein
VRLEKERGCRGGCGQAPHLPPTLLAAGGLSPVADGSVVEAAVAGLSSPCLLALAGPSSISTLTASPPPQLPPKVMPHADRGVAAQGHGVVVGKRKGRRRVRHRALADGHGGEEEK